MITLSVRLWRTKTHTLLMGVIQNGHLERQFSSQCPLKCKSYRPRVPVFSLLTAYSFFFFFKLYKIVLVLPNIKMNPPQVYMCSPSWTLLHPPSPYHPSGLSQCTSPKHHSIFFKKTIHTLCSKGYARMMISTLLL